MVDFARKKCCFISAWTDCENQIYLPSWIWIKRIWKMRYPESLFGSHFEDNDSNIFGSKGDAVSWTQRPPEPKSIRKSLVCISIFIWSTYIKTPADAFWLYLYGSIIENICRCTNSEGNFNSELDKLLEYEMWAWFVGLPREITTQSRTLKICGVWTWSTDEVSGRLFYPTVMGGTSWNPLLSCNDIFFFSMISAIVLNSVARRPLRSTKAQKRTKKDSPYQQHLSRSRQNAATSSTVPATDSLKTVRLVTERVRENIMKVYFPSQDLTGDKRMIPYRGTRA